MKRAEIIDEIFKTATEILYREVNTNQENETSDFRFSLIFYWILCRKYKFQFWNFPK